MDFDKMVEMRNDIRALLALIVSMARWYPGRVTSVSDMKAVAPLERRLEVRFYEMDFDQMVTFAVSQIRTGLWLLGSQDDDFELLVGLFNKESDSLDGSDKTSNIIFPVTSADQLGAATPWDKHMLFGQHLVQDGLMRFQLTLTKMMVNDKNGQQQ